MGRISTSLRYGTYITGQDPHSLGEFLFGKIKKNEVFVTYEQVIRS